MFQKKIYDQYLHCTAFKGMDTTIITIKILNYYHDIVDTESMLIVISLAEHATIVIVIRKPCFFVLLLFSDYFNYILFLCLFFSASMLLL